MQISAFRAPSIPGEKFFQKKAGNGKLPPILLKKFPVKRAEIQKSIYNPFFS
jgi:hypothetical protein